MQVTMDRVDPGVDPRLLNVGATNGAVVGLVLGLFFAAGAPAIGLIGGLLLGAAFGAGAVTVLSGMDDQRTRMLGGAALGAVGGAVFGLLATEGLLPALKSTPMIGWTAALAIIGAVMAWLMGRDIATLAAAGAAVGWFVATLGVPSLGSGTRVEAIMVFAVLGGLVGFVMARNPVQVPEQVLRPAMLFLAGVASFGGLRLMHTYGTDENLEQLVTTVVNVSLAIGAFAAIWVGMNLVFNQAGPNWPRFSATLGGIIGLVITAVLVGNRAVSWFGAGPEEITLLTRFAGFVEEQVNGFSEASPDGSPWNRGVVVAIVLGLAGYFIGRGLDSYHATKHYRPALAGVGAVLGALYGYHYTGDLPGNTPVMLYTLPLIGGAILAIGGWLLAGRSDRQGRLTIGIATGAIFGLFLAVMSTETGQPRMTPLPLPIAVAVVGTIGFGVSTLRGRDPIRGALWGALVGWIIGAWGVPDIGNATLPEAIAGYVGPAAIAGALAGLTSLPDVARRAVIDQKSRAWIFMAPAVLFVSATLVLPTIITFFLSLQSNDKDGRWVGVENYNEIIRAPGLEVNPNLDLSGAGDLFGSDLFRIGGVLLLVGLLTAVVMGMRTGRTTDFDPQSGGVVMLGVVMLGFAVFSVLRGTIINNLWWVFAVTAFATGFGLAVAAWADGIKGEKIAKSLIFMPMAISAVGAAIIWRFMYSSRPAGKDQNGILNAAWIWLGEKTSGEVPFGVGFFGWEFFSFNGKPLFILLFAAIAGALLWSGLKSGARNGPSAYVAYAVAALFPLWIIFRILVDGHVGGLVENSAGELVADPILFRETSPFNNFWLMVVMLWIETGFAMVILSAAIKAVPSEFIEAAKIDGADDSQVFWRIVIPQIAPTIGVVVTTIIVKVTKVYDYVKVMTGGNFDTNVLANSMIDQSFQFANAGTGSALAVLLFIMVLPIMVLNVLRMQREAA